MTQTVLPVSLSPTYYTFVSKYKGAEHNILVKRVKRKDGAEVIGTFKFDGHTLQKPRKLLEVFPGSVVGQIQVEGWKCFPRDVFGNVVIYTDGARVLSSGCVLIESNEGVLVESDNSFLIQSPRFKGANSQNLVAVKSPLSLSDNSPDSVFEESIKSKSKRSPHARFETSPSCISSGGNNNNFWGTTQTVAENSTNLEISHCDGLNIRNCYNTTFEGTRAVTTPFTGLSRRRVISGKIELRWYEAIKHFLFGSKKKWELINILELRLQIFL